MHCTDCLILVYSTPHGHTLSLGVQAASGDMDQLQHNMHTQLQIHVHTVLDAAITAREGAILGHITYRCAHPAPKLSTLNLSCQALVPPRLCIPVPTLTVNWPAHAAQWGPMQDATGPAQLILGNSIRV